MRRILIDPALDAGGRPARAPNVWTTRPNSWVQRLVLASLLAVGFVLSASQAAPAFTLKLTFSDGQPMTYGSACLGDGCLARSAGVRVTDAAGQVRLPDEPGATVEYRRDGIDLSQVHEGGASGRVRSDGDRVTVVLPRLLLGSAPAVDELELDIVARINEARAAHGLAPAAVNERLSAAADLHATWLDNSAVGLPLPILSHEGPFGTSLAFRLGEASFPEPTTGSEFAAAGSTPAQALVFWLGSAPHRALVLAPGPLLIGVSNVGRVIIIETHAPCAGCQPGAPINGGAGGAGGPSGGGGAGGAPTSASGNRVPQGGTPGVPGAAGAHKPASCGREQLGVRRLRPRQGRLRLRVSVRCLGPRASYRLAVVQRPSRSILTTRRISGAGAITLALRPTRRTHTLRVKLKRNGRAVVARSVTARR